jgi:hypothetical protein
MLTYQSSIELPHSGDCGLLGVSPDLTLYVEEIYTEDAWIAQHAVTLEGTFLESVDEDYGKNTEVMPLVIPDGSIQAQSGTQTIKTLNFTGARHRGLREDDRITDVVHPFSVGEKMTLVQQLGLSIMPPQLLGIAESYVLAEAELQRPYRYVVCRRVRLAYALPNPQLDENGQSYDYDTYILYIAHLFDRRNEEVSFIESLQSLPEADLYRPMDCLITKNYLFVADGGGETRNNRIHMWKIEPV